MVVLITGFLVWDKTYFVVEMPSRPESVCWVEEGAVVSNWKIRVQ